MFLILLPPSHKFTQRNKCYPGWCFLHRRKIHTLKPFKSYPERVSMSNVDKLLSREYKT